MTFWKKMQRMVAVLLVGSLLLCESVTWADPADNGEKQPEQTIENVQNDEKEQEKTTDDSTGNLTIDSEALNADDIQPSGESNSDLPQLQDIELNEGDDSEPVSVQAEFTDDTERMIRVTLSNSKLDASSFVQCAAWSEINDQADMQWYVMKREENGTYTYTLDVSNFKDPGKIKVHVYSFDEAYNPTWLGNDEIFVNEISGGTIEIVNYSRKTGMATVKISGLSVPSGISKVMVPIWSKEDQSDIIWYDATKRADGWYVDFNMANHGNNKDVYVCHVYAVDGNKFEKFIGASSLDFTMGESVIEATVDEEKGTLAVSLQASDIPGSFLRIQFAAWTDDGGQDDLGWYIFEQDKSSNNWKKEIPLSAFAHTGKGNVHVYVVNENYSMSYAGAAKFELPSPSAEKVEASVENMDKGTFSVKIVGITPENVKMVQVPIWSSNGGQDDIIWYTATKDSNGDYKVTGTIADHQYDIGKYQAHVYVTDKNGLKSFVGNDEFEFTSDVGDVTVTEVQKEKIYRASLQVKAYPAGLSKVEFAVWSAENGQDDIIWYEAKKSGSNYTVDIDISNHKTFGVYNVHVYGTTKSGNKVWLGASSDISVNGIASGKVSVESKNDGAGTFKVKISGVDAPSRVSGVKLAAWSKPDQSDIVWYDCNKQNDSTYVIDVNVANHQYNLGDYVFHSYVTMGNGIQCWTDGTSYTFNPENFIYVVKNTRGKRTLGIKNPTNAGDIRFAVWSDANGQDDIVWYSAKQVDGNTWTAEMSTQYHKSAGSYSVHVYSYSNMSILGVTAFDIPIDEFIKNGWYYETINGRTYKLYYKNDVLQTDVRGILGNVGSYRAEINRQRCTVTIYAQDGANGYIIPVVAFACSVGLPSTPTPTGVYYTSEKMRWGMLMGPSYGQYCTRIFGGILFHSVAGSNMTSYNLSAAAYNMLGQPASHGCVRLCVRDAKWIYDNCSLGMQVTIYDSAYAGPLGKPATIKIPASQKWDPTDPNV